MLEHALDETSDLLGHQIGCKVSFVLFKEKFSDSSSGGMFHIVACKI